MEVYMRRMLTPYLVTRSLPSDLFSEMDKLFEGFPEETQSKRFSEESALIANCDVTESQSHFYLTADLPGVKKSDIKVEVNENILTISGERHREFKAGEMEQAYQRFERSYGTFRRSFTLPSTIAIDKIEAHYENGVLQLVLPKAEAAKSRSIEVQSGNENFLSRFWNQKKEGSRDSQKETQNIAIQ